LEKLISGVQQIGIGIPNVHEAWSWYRTNFSMDVPVFEEAATADLMIRYTGDDVHARHAILALNLQGGGGFEIWQYTSREPQASEFDLKLGDLGIYVCKMKSLNVEQAFQNFDKTYLLSKELEKAPDGSRHFFVRDPYGNVFQVVQSEKAFTKDKADTGGVFGAIIGVSDIERSTKFYSDLLGYDKVIYEGEGNFKDFGQLNNGRGKFKRVILSHSEPRKGGFSQLLGESQIELVQDMGLKANKIFENRFWGDLGFIHLCFDIVNMKALQNEAEKMGHPFTVDSSNSFDMGEAAGHFSYVEDPDGSLIEFVETHKIPIFKKIGWYLDMRKRNAEKPLPKWMLKSLSLNRKK